MIIDDGAVGFARMRVVVHADQDAIGEIAAWPAQPARMGERAHTLAAAPKPSGWAFFIPSIAPPKPVSMNSPITSKGNGKANFSIG